MKRLVAIIASIALALVSAPLPAQSIPRALADEAGGARVTKDIADIDDVLVNPGKGWWFLGGDMIDWNYPVRIKDDGSEEPLDDVESQKEAAAGTSKWFVGRATNLPGSPRTKWPDYSDIIGLGYFRFHWCDIEPVEGEYHWEAVERLIDIYDKAGKKFAFGVASASSLDDEPYITPKWLFDKGAEYVQLTNLSSSGQLHEQYVPVWDDPVYLEAQHKLVKAIAERYDGDPRIAFIDIRGYGNYGEQHLHRLSYYDDAGYVAQYSLSAAQLKELYIKPYQDAFDKTLLITPSGDKTDEYRAMYEQCIAEGVTVRRDGILGADDPRNPDDPSEPVAFWTDGWETEIAADKLPTVFELALGGTYSALVQRRPAQWDTGYLTSCVAKGQPSYMLLFYDMYRDNKAYCDWMANRLGYWLRLKHAEFDSEITAGDESSVALTFENDGAASMFEPNESYVALLDKSGKVVSKCKTGWNAYEWKPNTEVTQETAAVKFDGVMPGAYRLAYGMFANDNDEEPTYLLGSAGKTDNKWYVLGDVTVKAREPYTNVAAMTADTTLNAGNVASTLAYHNGGPASGGGTYVIERHDDWKADYADGGLRIMLANGLWAVLQQGSSVVDVRQFGAVGNGTVDDAPAVQAALDAGAETVNVSPGTYALASTVNFRSNTRMTGIDDVGATAADTDTCVFTHTANGEVTELFACAQDTRNVKIAGIGFDLAPSTGVRALTVAEGVEGLLFHTKQPLLLDFAASPALNDVIVDAELDVVFGAGSGQAAALQDADARMATGFSISWQDTSGAAWSNMRSCKDGFLRSIEVTANATPARLVSDCSGAEGSIVWSSDREIEAGATATISLVCQDGIWHELGAGVFSSVSALRADTTLAAGDRARTLAYYLGASSAGKGAYVIEDHADWAASRDDGGLHIRLASGLWAVLDTSGSEVNAAQFGARGDGVADDTAALNNALAAAKTIGTADAPFAVNLSAGDFLITGKLAIGSNTMFKGISSEKTRIVAGGDWLRSDIAAGENVDTAMLLSDQSSNVCIERMSFDGSTDIAAFEAEVIASGEPALWIGTGQWTRFGRPAYNVMDIRRGHSIAVRDCRICNCIATGAQIIDNENLSFDDCTFANLGEGISSGSWTHSGATPASKITVHGCTFDGYTLSEAIVFRANGAAFSNISITGNRILNKTRGAGISLGRSDSTCTFSDVLIEGNTIEACEHGIEVRNATGNTTVNDNTVSGAKTGLLLSTSTGVTAAGNTVTGCSNTALSLQDCTNSTVTKLAVSGLSAESTAVSACGNGTGTSVSAEIEIEDGDSIERVVSNIGEGYDLAGIVRAADNPGVQEPEPGESPQPGDNPDPSGGQGSNDGDNSGTSGQDQGGHKPTAPPQSNESSVKVSAEQFDVASIGKQAYRAGKAVTPAPVVTCAGTRLVAGRDYTLSYANNKRRGTAKVTIFGTGSYTGTKTVTFKIGKASAKKFTVKKLKKQKYRNGKAVKPKPAVKYAGAKLKRGRDYTLSYKNNKKRGTAKAIIKGKGNYTGKKTVKFKIS